MTIGKPGIVTITDNAGTWTAGDAIVNVNGTGYTQSYDAVSKDTSMAALAALISADVEVDTASYNSFGHVIVITPMEGSQLNVVSDLSGITGSMTFSIETAPAYPQWATNLSTKTEPSSPKKLAGWVADEKPPAKWWNWLFNIVYQWILHFDERIPLPTFGDFDLVFPDTQFTVQQTANCHYRIDRYSSGQKIAILSIPEISGGISNGHSFSANGYPIPSECRPKNTVHSPCTVWDHGYMREGVVQILHNGSVSIGLYSMLTGAEIPGSETDPLVYHVFDGFDDSSGKGLLQIDIVYSIWP